MSGPSFVSGRRRVAGLVASQRGEQTGFKSPFDPRVHEHPAGRVASLSAGQAEAVGNGLGGEIEVGIRADDCGVAAAEFEREFLGEILGECAGERASGGHASR